MKSESAFTFTEPSCIQLTVRLREAISPDKKRLQGAEREERAVEDEGSDVDCSKNARRLLGDQGVVLMNGG